MSSVNNLDEITAKFTRGDRKTLSEVITLVESTASRDKHFIASLLNKLTQKAPQTIRIAISGPPGVGKSTFINTLGKKIVSSGHKLAVLPIDPSSDLNFGSILGDKTRMKDLLLHDDVFIRPSPAKGALGGIAYQTHDVLFVVEAFGFDVVIIETVGVGQSEMQARDLTDYFVLLMQPGSGDQLQAMKKGIVERADFVLVNKADHAQLLLAKKTLASLLFLRHEEVYLDSISAQEDIGIDKFWQALITRHQTMKKTGRFIKARQEKRVRLCEQLFVQTCAQRIKEQVKTDQCARVALAGNAEDQALGPLVSAWVDEVMKNMKLSS